MGDYSALKCSLSTISPVALRDSSRKILTKLDNYIVLKSTRGYFRDYRGLAELMEFDYHDVRSFEKAAHPTMRVLESWEKRPGATLDQLIDYLEDMERYDIIQDLIPTLSFEVEIVPREDWGACTPVEVHSLVTPVKHIFICHTVTSQCHSIYEGSVQMRRLQKYHMSIGKAPDIGYNFVIGGDGKVYEGVGWDKAGRHTLNWNHNSYGIAFTGNYNLVKPGRSDISYNFVIGGDDGEVYEGVGWDRRGSHTLHWNHQSYGIAFIGNYNLVKPNCNIVRAAILLIDKGIEMGCIAADHWVHGARDARNTESPGDELYAIIRRWPRFQGDLSVFETAIEGNNK